jgi:hypothetical protein
MLLIFYFVIFYARNVKPATVMHMSRSSSPFPLKRHDYVFTSLQLSPDCGQDKTHLRKCSRVFVWTLVSLFSSFFLFWSRDSVVGTGTRYGLDGPGIESRWGRDFSHVSARLWGTPSRLYNGYRVFLGSKAAGACRWPLNPIWRRG